MMPAKPNLRVVKDEPPPPDLSYEWQERQRIARKNWAAVHIAGDRRAPIYLPDVSRRGWRG